MSLWKDIVNWQLSKFQKNQKLECVPLNQSEWYWNWSRVAFFCGDFIYRIYWCWVPLCFCMRCPCNGAVWKVPLSIPECPGKGHGLCSTRSSPRRGLWAWNAAAARAASLKEPEALGNGSSPGVMLSPACSLCAKIASSVENALGCPTSIPALNRVLALLLVPLLHIWWFPMPRLNYRPHASLKLLLKFGFSVYEACWKGLVPEPRQGPEPGGCFAGSKSLGHLDPPCWMLCTEREGFPALRASEVHTQKAEGR